MNYTCLSELPCVGFRRLYKKWNKKCVISYMGDHLKPKKNLVCSGSEHKQREKAQTRNQRVRAGREDSHLDKRLARTIREEGPDRAKEKL